MLRKILFVISALLLALPASARILIVEGVVSPAWVERGGAREPLAPGMQLADKDRIVTGGGARVMLRMAEGSAVKLGENATLALDNLAEKKGSAGNSAVSGTLDVVKGAFRFTTGIFGKSRSGRDVTVRISTITAGIRGTDVWGRSREDLDLVCLLEGRISVSHGKQDFVMDEPLQFFIAPRNAPPKPVGKVDKKQIDEWSLETEISDGLGSVRAGGRLRVEVLRTADATAARNAETRLRNAGYPAATESAGGSYGPAEYVVYIGNVATAKERDVLLERARDVLAGKVPAAAPSGAPAKY